MWVRVTVGVNPNPHVITFGLRNLHSECVGTNDTKTSATALTPATDGEDYNPHVSNI